EEASEPMLPPPTAQRRESLDNVSGSHSTVAVDRPRRDSARDDRQHKGGEPNVNALLPEGEAEVETTPPPRQPHRATPRNVGVSRERIESAGGVGAYTRSAADASTGDLEAPSNGRFTSKAEDTADDDSPPSAWVTVLDKTRGDEEMAGQLAVAFIEEAEQLLPLMRDQLNDGDAAALHRSAHTLKGAAGCLGADSVITSAQRLERQANTGDVTSAGWMLDELVRCTQAYLKNLNQSQTLRPPSA
ncbi:MAG: Hpt domain-containing protein, partial [Rhodopirellula sp. JB053]